MAETAMLHQPKESQESAPLRIRDLDTGRMIPIEQADLLWQPMLVLDLDSNTLRPLEAIETPTAVAQELLAPPAATLRFRSYVLEVTKLKLPLALLQFRLSRIEPRTSWRPAVTTEVFRACRRTDESGATHFDVRWKDGPLQFTGKLECLQQTAPEVQELAMYDDHIYDVEFPRELGFIRMKRVEKGAKGERLIEVVIPKVSLDSSSAEHVADAAVGDSTMHRYDGKRSLEQMFVLRGKISILDNRPLVELRHRDDRGKLVVALSARRMKTAKDDAWKVASMHPLSAFQTFCVLLAINNADGARVA
uniref:Uncharacterized protein n=1 Tax=Chrysotila carterae TaxID=13221 RepID=A0A7S4BZZ5_CHRCT